MMKTLRFFLLFLFVLSFSFTLTVSDQCEKDSCTKALIQTLEGTIDKRFGKLEADMEVIIRGLNLSQNLQAPSGYATCRDIYLNHGKSLGNTAYMLQTDTGTIPVYCHMTNDGIGACGGGGWTLVMKMDGHKRSFHYDSSYWTNKAEFNRLGGKTGFDSSETKLPTYWNASFSKICLGMKVDQQLRFVVINKTANSLYSLIADGKYRATSLGRDTWKSLIGSQASLQPHCNKEGFNPESGRGKAWPKARIGILGNQENECQSCDSRIGFGTGSPGGIHDDSNTCGNEATHSADNGNKHIKAMGYILVQ